MFESVIIMLCVTSRSNGHKKTPGRLILYLTMELNCSSGNNYVSSLINILK